VKSLKPELAIPPFQAAWYAPGGHLQTIVGNYLRRDCPAPQLKPLVVPLPDGDAIVLHVGEPEGCLPDDKRPMVLLMHGLGGTHKSAYVLRAAVKLMQIGYRVAAIDHRGCGVGLAHAKRVTHAGRWQDIDAAVHFLRERYSPSKLVLVGYSLSGNMVLKWGAETALHTANETAIMSVCPPVDLMECSEWIERRRSWAYNQSFCKNLIQTVERRRKERPDAYHIDLPRRPKTLREFDSLFTAPLGGFSSVEEYYSTSSSAPNLEKIAASTLILAAADDPIVPIRPLEKAKLSESTQLVITPGGGHLGYLTSSKNDPDRRWMDWRVVDFVKSVAPLSA